MPGNVPERRMAAIAIAFAAGILAVQYASAGVCALIAAAAAVIACFVFKDASTRTAVFILLAVLALGAARYAVSSQIPADEISRCRSRTAGVEGTVCSDPESVSDHVRMVLRVDRARTASGWQNVSGDVMASLYSNEGDYLPELQYGDRVRIDAFAYPPDAPTNPGQFSWKESLARQGIYTCISASHSWQVNVLPGKKRNPVLWAAFRLRESLIQAIYRNHPAKEAALITGVALGTYAYLPRGAYRDLTRTGTIHILAASGYNCYILIGIAALMLKGLGLTPKWRNLAVVALIGLYLIVVGPKPSHIRAAVMASLVLLAVPLQRIPITKCLFFTAALAVLAFDPSNLFDAGFQISFLAVAGLIWAGPIIHSVFAGAGLFVKQDRRRRSWYWRWFSKPVAILASTAIATIAIWLASEPVVAYHFNLVSLTSVPANMAIVLAVPIILVDGLLSPIFAPLGFLGTAIGCVGTLATRFLVCVVHYFGSMQYSAISVQSPGVGMLVGYYLLLWAALSYVESRINARKA